MMEEEKKTHPVEGDIEDFCEENERDEAVLDEDVTQTVSARAKIKKMLPRVAIFTHYLMPLAVSVIAFVLSCLYITRIAVGTATMELSTVRLYANTLAASREYFFGDATRTVALNWFYGLTTAASIIGILLFVAGVALAVIAAVSTIRAFRAGFESEESNRAKVLFQILFPNRICFYLSYLLLVIPLFYPEFFSAIGQHLLLSGSSADALIFILLNRPLIVIGVLCLLALLLAVFVPRLERKWQMNMHLLWHPEESDEGEKEDDEEEE